MPLPRPLATLLAVPVGAALSFSTVPSTPHATAELVPLLDES